MANTKGTKNTKSKSTAASSRKKSTSKSKSAKSTRTKEPEFDIDLYEEESSRKPIRRELGAVVFLILGVFLVIGLFNTEGKFIEYLVSGVKGLIGQGYWAMIPACFIASYTLFFHRGKPVAHKVTGLVLAPVFFGELLYIICNVNVNPANGFVNALFLQGQRMQNGGVITGLLGYGMEYLLGSIGAIVFTSILLAVSIYCGMSGGFDKFFSKIGKLTQGEYNEKDYVRPERTRAASVPAQTPMDIPLPKPSASTRRAVVDIPLGESSEPLDIDFIHKGDPVAAVKPSRTKVRKKGPAEGQESPTARVIPLDYDEAVEFTGMTPIQTRPEPKTAAKATSVPDPDGFITFPVEKTPKTTPPTPAPAPAVSIPETRRKPKEVMKADELEKEVQEMTAAVSAAEENPSGYVFPPVSLLRTSTVPGRSSGSEIEETQQRLDSALKSFGISAAIVGVIRGPTVTRYDIALEQGVKLSRVTNLAGDIALSLGVVNVRIAPIPDKISTVGIEVPNKIVTTVYLRDIIESSQFTTAKSKVSFAIGKDIGGNCMVGNIAKLPHMLIAGTTGSGKSVCMNSLILSLLYKATPDEVRLIMIDPKMVELGIYNSIPHLYVPVVTDPKKAAGALQWSVVEMLKRYRLFSEIGVRDLEAYNKHCRENGEKTLPQVVIVIDELADLMMVASKDVEESICRVAQMGRAAGMHLVIATQRPSADVITGLMKANIPSRIAFAVSSSMESRIILDQVGAEKLIGMGDMLYSPVGCGKPVRIQGAFVSDEERENVIDFIKENCSSASADNNSEIMEYMNKATEDKNGGGDSGKSSGKNASNEIAGEYDEMLPQAVEAVIEAKSCSVSMLQRRVKLGYSRAARIVDQMEELGIVGPYEGAKPRQVVVTREEWKQIQVRLGLLAEDDLALAAEMSEEPDYTEFDGE